MLAAEFVVGFFPVAGRVCLVHLVLNCDIVVTIILYPQLLCNYVVY